MKTKFRSFGMLGKHHSEATKRKISAAKKGQKYHMKRKRETFRKSESSEDEEEEEHDDVFMNTLREIRLMGQDIFSNPLPLREHPDILRKIRILNYALAEWNDECERRYGKPKNPRSKEEILNEIFSKYYVDDDSKGRLIN